MSKEPRLDSNPMHKLALIFNNCKLSGKCFEWQGSYFLKKDVKTYPYVYYKNKVWRGNRLVWFLKHGVVPDDLWILHKCDNKKCVNPDHLYLGTPKQNAVDMSIRGRTASQKKTHCSRGHEFTKINTHLYTRKDGRNLRVCLGCRKFYNSKKYRDGKDY